MYCDAAVQTESHIGSSPNDIDEAVLAASPMTGRDIDV